MNSLDPDFNWHVNGLYVALGADNSVYTDTAATTGWGARASLIARTNLRWSRLQELGYSIQGYVQPAPAETVPVPTSVDMARLMLGLAHGWLKQHAPEHLSPQPKLYTCIGKGGTYELLGQAQGAGNSKLTSDLMVYRDVQTSKLFFRTVQGFETRMQPKLVDVPDLPVVAEHMALTGDTADVVLAELPQNAMNCIDRAVDALLRARARNTVMQTKWVVGSDFWHANESIDDEIHNALAALGQ